jgi:hypothetical protein
MCPQLLTDGTKCEARPFAQRYIEGRGLVWFCWNGHEIGVAT